MFYRRSTAQRNMGADRDIFSGFCFVDKGGDLTSNGYEYILIIEDLSSVKGRIKIKIIENIKLCQDLTEQVLEVRVLALAGV